MCTFIYAMPTSLVESFIDFTNDYTVYEAEIKQGSFDIGGTILILLHIDEDDIPVDLGENPIDIARNVLDEYVGKFISVCGRVNEWAKTMGPRLMVEADLGL